MSPEYRIELFKAALSLGVAIVTLVITWYVGNRLSTAWNIHQKRKELNLEAVHVLHDLYGEFKEVVKLWRLVKRPLQSHLEFPPSERWTLLARSCALESMMEALVLRLATERRLAGDQALTIGLFRQAVQTLRECIRDDIDCPLGSRREEYRLLNELAPKVAAVVSSDLPSVQPSAALATEQLAQIVGVTSKAWRAKVGDMKTSRADQAEPAEEEDA